MMKRCLAILGCAALLAACAAGAWAQDRRGPGGGAPGRATGVDSGAERQPANGRRGEGYGRGQPRDADRPAPDGRPAMGPGRRGWGAYLEREIDRDLAWLRERGLDEYADRVEAVRGGQSPTRHVLLWRVHRRIQGLGRLAGQDAERAIEQIKLDFATARLAREYRQASDDEKAALEPQLRENIRKLLDLRIEVQRAMMDSIRARLDEIRGQLRKREQLRDELVERRFTQLSDPDVPLPDPMLESMPGSPGADGPADEGAGPREAPGDRPEPPGVLDRSHRRGPQYLDRLFEGDIAWLRLRENGLDEMADRMVEIRDSEAPARRMVLWRIHRRIEQWRRLKGDDAKRAIESARLAFEVVRLARQYREAPQDGRGALAANLRDALSREFLARQAAQTAVMDAIQERLESTRRNVQKQRELKRQLIHRRFAELTDPSHPAGEPELVPHGAPEPRD